MGCVIMYAWTDPTHRDIPVLLAIPMANTLGRVVRVVVVVVRVGVMRVVGGRGRGGGSGGGGGGGEVLGWW